MTTYSLLLEFDTDSKQFGRGFEAGRVWAHLRGSHERVVEHVHADNLEMMLRMAEALDRPLHTDDRNDDWVEVTFDPPEVLGG